LGLSRRTPDPSESAFKDIEQLLDAKLSKFETYFSQNYPKQSKLPKLGIRLPNSHPKSEKDTFSD